MFAQLVLLKEGFLCFVLPQARKLQMPLDVTLTKLKVLWQSKSLHFHCKSGLLKLWVPQQKGMKQLRGSHAEPVDNSNVLSDKRLPGFILGFCIILDVSGFLCRTSLFCRGCFGCRRKENVNSDYFCVPFPYMFESFSAERGSWMFEWSQKSIKSNPVLNFPFSKSDKKAKVNWAQGPRMLSLQNSDRKCLCREVTVLRTSNKWWGWGAAQRTWATNQPKL